MWRLWMSQSGFSLGFLSQYSFWKLSIFCGYVGYLYLFVFGMRRVSFSKIELASSLASRLDWAASSSRKLTEWPIWTFLSCSALAGITLQLLRLLGMYATSGSLQAANSPRGPVSSPCYFAQTWAFVHTLSHTTLTWFPPKYKVTNC